MNYAIVVLVMLVFGYKLFAFAFAGWLLEGKHAFFATAMGTCAFLLMIKSDEFSWPRVLITFFAGGLMYLAGGCEKKGMSILELFDKNTNR